MKANYYLSQAELKLKHPNEAYDSALLAYDLCLELYDKSIQNISQQVLQCKQAKWEVQERKRIAERKPLLRKLEDTLKTGLKADLDDLEKRVVGEVEKMERRNELQKICDDELEELRNSFAISDPDICRRRVRYNLRVPIRGLSLTLDPGSS